MQGGNPFIQGISEIAFHIRKGAAHEIYEIREIRPVGVPHLHGMHGLWRGGGRAALVDLG